MTAMLFTLPKQRLFDANGEPMPGAKVYIYDTGTTTPKTTYTNRARTIAHTHPIVADADGYVAAVYPPDGTYKITITDQFDVVALPPLDDQQGPLDLSAFITSAAGLVETVIYETATVHASNVTDYGKIFVCDASGGAILFNLPTTISNAGKQITILNNGNANAVTLDPSGAEQIDGSGTLVLYPGERDTFVSDGAGWVRKVRGFRTSIYLGAAFDCDALVQSGQYEISSPANGPGAGHWFVDVSRSRVNGANFQLQLAWRQDVDDQAVYMRRRVAGVFGPWRLQQAPPTTRQTVTSGPTDANGLPLFLPSTAASLAITTQNVSASIPFVVTAAGGETDRNGRSITNLTWSALTASATCYLYVDISADGTLVPGFTTLSPTYQWGGTYPVTSGQYTYNIQDAVGKAGTGSAANTVYRVFVGEAVTNASTVTSTVAYAYKGRYLSPPGTLFAPGSNVSFAHNIGVQPVLRVDFLLKNVTAEHNYTAGMFTRLRDVSGVAGVWADRNTWTYCVNVGLLIYNRTTGANAVPTSGNWNTVVTIDRGW
jgi:hypothetical protein